ncbi:MAG: class I SAM-dependent methyltransferase [Lachnospiraceae bacterium]|nr:class I SAM-dependent methyltransferase [Lachnospiraceae bacterium]
MNSRIAQIRESERKSHTEIYSKETLYDSDSWLAKPIKTVREIVPSFSDHDVLRVLDLGCGVGRNSIFIAEQFAGKDCLIDCVDILDIAIEKLQVNAQTRGVAECIRGCVDTIEHFPIKKDSYDLIIAVSALEHVESKEAFLQKLREIEEGVKEYGIVCLVINSEVRESVKETGEDLKPQFEVNLKSDELQSYLDEVFAGWETVKSTMSFQEYDIPRDNLTSHLTTNVVTYVGHKDICK